MTANGDATDGLGWGLLTCLGLVALAIVIVLTALIRSPAARRG